MGQNNLWTAFYWSDYLRDTGDLTALEHGIYLLLLANYYAKSQPLPSDRKRLIHELRLHTKKECQVLDDILARFFVKDNDVYRNKRADAELAKRNDISEKRAEAASKRYANAPTSAEQLQTHTHTHTQKIKTKGAEERALELPDWVPVTNWEAYLKMRRDIRKPASRHAQVLAIGKLDHLRKQGYKPDAVLDQSTFNCWQGLFELGSKGKPLAPQTNSLSDDFMAMRRKYEKDLQ